MAKKQSGKKIRRFKSGATRDTDLDKHDPEGFLSPLVIRRFDEYMHAHRVQADGTLRGSDNWQKGIPKDQYMKSELRHVLDHWLIHRGYAAFDVTGKQVDLQDALCAIIFNASGYLFELLKRVN